MDIVINQDSTTPIYRQITEQIANQILQNKLHAHEILPSIRAIALNLKISVITSKRAYEELETMGLIYTLSGVGCFVSDINHLHALSIRNDLFKERMKKELEYYKSQGMNNDDIIKLVQITLNENQVNKKSDF